MMACSDCTRRLDHYPRKGNVADNRLTLGLRGEGQSQFGEEFVIFVTALFGFGPEAVLTQVLWSDLSDENRSTHTES